MSWPLGHIDSTGSAFRGTGAQFTHRLSTAHIDDYDPTLGAVTESAPDDVSFEGTIEYLTTDELRIEGVNAGSFWLEAHSTSLTREPKIDDSVIRNGVEYTVLRVEEHTWGANTSGWRILCQGVEQ